MSDTASNLTENLGIAHNNIGFAMQETDYARIAMFLGKAASAIDLCLTDVIDLATDPVAAQAAFDAGKAGEDE